jgi:pSer/pThr/pTyr-binding forkhead associated (FHA) protein
MWILKSQEPEVAFRVLPGEVRTIGRATGAQFVVEAPLVSRVHCRLTCARDGQLTVEDLGSTNGTSVDARRIDGAVPLQAGQTLTVGRVAFEVLKAEGTS